jgi:ferric-dicitrate binding protein FerR (iron transport regulator)
MKKEIKKIIGKYFDNSISNEELEELDVWRREDAENDKHFHQLKTVLHLSEVHNKEFETNQKRVWGRLANRISEENPQTSLNHPGRTSKLTYWLRAASILIVFTLGAAMGIVVMSGGFFNKENNIITREQSNQDSLVFTSNASSKSEVILPDGSKVWLNSNSEIKFSPDFKTREVFLTGEAYFDVSKTENEQYFYVHTSDVKVEVLGTEFNVKSYPEEGIIETTLEEGEIVLYKKLKDRNVKITTMKPAQHATFIRKHGKIFMDQIKEEIDPETNLKPAERKEQLLISESIDTKKYTSWKEGHLIIDGESFESFVKKMERWYDVQIVIKNERVKKLHFTANFKNETIEQALKALKIAHPFDYSFNVDKNLILIE